MAQRLSYLAINLLTTSLLMAAVGLASSITPRTLVLKSPNHKARVQTLLELLPKARFLHIQQPKIPSGQLHEIGFEMPETGPIKPLRGLWR